MIIGTVKISEEEVRKNTTPQDIERMIAAKLVYLKELIIRELKEKQCR